MLFARVEHDCNDTAEAHTIAVIDATAKGLSTYQFVASDYDFNTNRIESNRIDSARLDFNRLDSNRVDAAPGSAMLAEDRAREDEHPNGQYAEHPDGHPRERQRRRKNERPQVIGTQ